MPLPALAARLLATTARRTPPVEYRRACRFNCSILSGYSVTLADPAFPQRDQSGRASEPRVSASKVEWGRHHTKPDAPVPKVGHDPAAARAARTVERTVPRAPAQHAGFFTIEIIIRLLFVVLVVFRPLGPTPLPHIPGHIQRPTLGLSLREHPHRRGAANTGFYYVCPRAEVLRLAPRGGPAIRVPRRPLPLRLGRQIHRETQPLAQPHAKRHRFLPSHPHARVVWCLIHFLVILGPLHLLRLPPLPAGLRPVFRF